nr:olfactory receptor 154 [Microplitis mediator]
MSKSDKDDYIAFHKLTKGLLTIGGLWRYEDSGFFYRLLPYKQLAISIGLSLAVLNYVFENFSNLSLVARGLSITTSFLSAAFKVICFMIRREDLTNLHKTLDPYFNEMLKDSKLSKFILRKVNTFRYISLVYAVLLSLCSVFYIVAPLIAIYYCHHHKINLTKYPLIYPTTYPWKIISTGLVYQIHYIFEILASLTLFFVTTSVDSLFTFYIFQMIGQLREISYCITNINDEDDGKSAVCKCVTQYEKILKCREILEKIYGPIILWIMTTNAIVLCTLLFQISQMKSITVIQGILFTTYFVLKMIQTFMYAWSGSCLIEESEDCRDSVYAANWYGNRRFMSSIVIMLSQRPLILTACNFSVVSVKIFVMILNTTISYFFLLQTLDDHE